VATLRQRLSGVQFALPFCGVSFNLALDYFGLSTLSASGAIEEGSKLSSEVLQVSCALEQFNIRACTRNRNKQIVFCAAVNYL